MKRVTLVLNQQGNNDQQTLKKTNTALMIALAVAVAALFLILIMLIVHIRRKQQSTVPPARVFSVFSNDETTDDGGEQTTIGMQTDPAPSESDAQTVYTPPAATAAPAANGGVGKTGLYRISSNTPSHAGLVVRQGPAQSTAKLTVLPENTLVEYDSSVPPENGYANVCWVDNDDLYYGWVLAKYLVYHSDAAFSGNWGSAPGGSTGGNGNEQSPGKSSGGGMGHEGYPYVCYSTPSHAGVVVRGGPSSSDEKLGVIPEGTALNPTGNTDNGYSEVVVDPYGAGYVGWVLTKYIAY